MKSLTVQQLQCFDAVIAEGSYQAAAIRLGRTHPTVFTAIKNLEAQLGVALFDRTGYRASPTEAGRALHTRVRSVLAELNVLCDRAARLAAGEETSLTVIVGDLCPLPPTLGLLRRFFEGSPVTQLDLRFEALGGPAERLSDGSADLILHYIDKTDPNLEFIDLLEVRPIPVVADGFLRFPITRSITPDQIAHLRPVRDRRQCQAGPLPELSSGGRRAPLDGQRSVDARADQRAPHKDCNGVRLSCSRHVDHRGPPSQRSGQSPRLTCLTRGAATRTKRGTTPRPTETVLRLITVGPERFRNLPRLLTPRCRFVRR